MQEGEFGLFTRFFRLSPHVVGLQSLTIWLASFVYLKRVADKVSCFAELDRYHRHLGILRDLIADYPCSEAAQQRLAVMGYAYFVKRPLHVLKWHANSALNGVEELSETCIISINLVFCLTTALLPGSRLQRVLQRVFKVSPFFLHHLLTLLPLLAPSPNVPSVLARMVPLRPLFLLYFALMGTHCWEVAIAAIVTFSSTLATTGLLLRAGVPLCYRPVPVITHIVLASVASLGWAATWDGLLPGTALLRRLRLSRRGALTASQLHWRRILQQSAGDRLADAFAGFVCPQHIMPAVLLERMPCKQWQDSSGNIHYRRMATVDAGMKVKFGRIRKRGVGSQQTAAGECSYGVWSLGEYLVGMANKVLLGQLPRRLKPSGRRGLEAAAGAENAREVDVRGQPAERHGVDHQRWALESAVAASTSLCPVGFQPVATAARQRFASQLHRRTLRIRIVGTEPDQLPDDWRERVFAHFNSDSSRCNTGNPKVQPAYLASGVAVRRGSIFLTVALVQMPSYHDGGEGPGWGQAWYMRGHTAEGNGVSATQSLSVARVLQAQAPIHSGPEADGGSAGDVTFATQQQQGAAVPVEPAGLRGHALVRTSSAGTDARFKHADAPAVHGHGIDGGSEGAHPSAGTAGLSTLPAHAPATSVTANEPYSPSLGVGQSPPMQSVQRIPGTGGSGSFGVLPSPGRRHIAAVWRAERHGAFHSTSPSSTPGNSNHPLHMLGPAAVSTVSPGSPRPSGILGQGAASLASSTTMSLAPGLGLAHVGTQQPMRYTAMLSPTQQPSMYTGPGPCAAPVGSATLVSYSAEPSPAVVAAVQLQHRGPGGWAGPASSLTHGSVRTGGGTASASMHVAQLLDAMLLRSRDNASREARHGCVLSVLTAVSQLDGGVPMHLRQVLGTEAWEADDAASSSWEADGVYERPPPPPPPPLALQQQQQQARRWAGEHAMSAANGLFELSDAPSPPPLATTGPLSGGSLSLVLQQQVGGQHVQTAATAGAATAQTVFSSMGNRTPNRAASITARPVHEPVSPLGYPGAAPSLVLQSGTAWASNTAVWPSHSAGLAVMADRATLPVRDVAVKPILICKAPLLHAAMVGDLAASIPPRDSGLTAAALPSISQSNNSPDVGSSTSPAVPDAPSSELGLSLMCAPVTVPELSVMLRYCGPASVFGEQTYLPVQLQLDPSSPAVAAAIRLQAAASDRDRRGGGDTQAARDVAEAAPDPLPAHATVRTALAALACPGVLYVELWHGPQLCACLPVLLLPESAASWAHEVCSLWLQQAEGEAGAVQGRAGAAAVSAAAHQVVEDLGGWLTYAAHKPYIAERAAATATAAAAMASPSSLGLSQAIHSQMAPAALTGGAAISTISTGTAATISPSHLLDEWFSGWLVDATLTDPSNAALPVIPQQSAVTAGTQNQPQLLPSQVPVSLAAGMQPGTTVVAHYPPLGSAYDPVGTAGGGGVANGCNRELFHDMMLQEGYNWLSDCVEAGCCGLAGALMDSLLSAGCSVAEVLRTCRSADGLPLINAATLSGNPAMMDLVWGWGQATRMDLLGWQPPPHLMSGALPATEVASGSEDAAYEARQGLLVGSTSAAVATTTAPITAIRDPRRMPEGSHSFAFASKPVQDHGACSHGPASGLTGTGRAGSRFRDAGYKNDAVVADTLPSRALRYLAGMLSWRVVNVPRLSRVCRVFPLLAAARSILGTRAGGMTGTTLSLSRQVDAACRFCDMTHAAWHLGRQRARRGMAALLRNGDAALMALHSVVLRVNVLFAEGGAEEECFLSHFQQRHGWVFSAWCWSMIPVYALILWRYLFERQWGQLAWTPLWMWMYVVCAAADLSGSTAMYRPRTEALAAAMHLSHTLSKALFCAGLPSYPVPNGRGRLYWMDVLACATLSAICEPVRICVAWPIRLVNFFVSTVLYRFTDTAPTYLEACLLSASCHCFGLLMQHAVESHHRRTFAALQQTASASSTGAAIPGGMPKLQLSIASANAQWPCNAASAASTLGTELPAPPRTASEQQQQQQNTPVPTQQALQLSLSTSQSRNLTTMRTATRTLEMNNWGIGYAAAATTGGPSTSTAAAAVDSVGSARPAADGSGAQLTEAPVMAALMEQCEAVFRANSESLERPAAYLRDLRCGDASGGIRYALGVGCSNPSFLDPREEFLLADGVWESSEGTSAWGLDHTLHSGALMLNTSPAAVPLSLLPRPPQEQLPVSPSPLSLREQWRRQQQQRYSQQQMQAQAAEIRGMEFQSYAHSSGVTESEVDEQEDGVCMHVCEELQPQVQVQPLSQPAQNCEQPGPTIPLVAVTAESDSQGPSTEPYATTAGVVSSSCGSNTQRAGSTSVSASGACHPVHSKGEVAASNGASDSCAGTGRSSENGGSSETGSGSGIRDSGRGSGRRSDRNFRYLVSRATGWVAGTLRRRPVRIRGSEAEFGHPS